MIDTSQIKELRDRTGISVVQCKKALVEAGGDMDKALTSLKAQGTSIADKKSSRNLGAGTIGAYVHAGGALGAMVEIQCETDFVAKNQEFKDLAVLLAMQVAAMPPNDVEELMSQDYIKDSSQTIDDLIKGCIQKFGERIEIIRFSRLAVGLE
jgi:elongation factor Ts